MDDDELTHVERAAAWRKRAEELRTVAQEMRHPLARDNLETLAQQWEAMAARIEKRLAMGAWARNFKDDTA